MDIAKKNIAFGMKKLLMLSLTVHPNLKLAVWVLFRQSIIDNEFTYVFILIGKGFDISLNVEIRECVSLSCGLIILKLWFLAYE